MPLLVKRTRISVLMSQPGRVSNCTPNWTLWKRGKFIAIPFPWSTYRSVSSLRPRRAETGWAI
jgi:hypothetical protein